MKFKLKVVKRFYVFGEIEVDADSLEDAQTKFFDDSYEGKIKEEDCTWEDQIEYEEGSFDLFDDEE